MACLQCLLRVMKLLQHVRLLGETLVIRPSETCPLDTYDMAPMTRANRAGGIRLGWHVRTNPICLAL